MSPELAPRWPRPLIRPRRRADERTNLSSNELHHPAVGSLVGRMLEGFDPIRLTRYPIQEEPAAAAAELYSRVPEEVLLTPGSDAAIRLIMLACRDVFDGHLLLQDPNYEAWAASAELLGGWIVRRVRKPQDDVANWLPQIREAAQTSPPSVVAVSWPNGPDGHRPPWGLLLDLLDTCRERGHLLVLDACYAAFSGDQEKVAALAGPHCLVLLSWSKAFGLAGGRLALAVGEPSLMRFLRAYRQEDHVNAVMLHALSATKSCMGEWRRVWADIADSREQIRRRLGELGVDSPPSGGNFLHLPLGGAEEAKELTAELSLRGFRVRDMGSTPGLRYHVRFTVACGPTRERFLDALEPLLRPIPSRGAA